MENKKRKSLKLAASIIMVAVMAFVISSCNKSSEESFSSEDTANASNESTTENTTSEVSDMASNVLNGSSQSGSAGGRTEGINDDRLACAGTQYSASGVTGSTGTLVVTFPADGCKDKKGNNRTGGFTITWSGGKWYTVGSTWTVTFNNYTVNGLAISGTRTHTVTAYTPPTSGSVNFSITSTIQADHTFTWASSSSTTSAATSQRSENKTRKWDHTALEDTYTVSNGPSSVSPNAASGTNRNKKSWTMSITKPLVYLGTCIKYNKTFIPVSGTKQLVVTGGKTYAIDYGDGVCNATFTVTVGGVTKTITAKNDATGD